MGKDDLVLAGQRVELVGAVTKSLPVAAQLLGHGYVKALRRVEAGAHGGAAQRQFLTGAQARAPAPRDPAPEGRASR